MSHILIYKAYICTLVFKGLGSIRFLNHFIHQGCVTLIQIDSKDVCSKTKLFISNKCSFFKTCYSLNNPEKVK